MERIFCTGLATVATLVFASTARAGPKHVESPHGDAGSLPGDAQIVFGSGPLEAIEGELTGGRSPGPGDFEDMYLIKIVDVDAFCASTTHLSCAGGEWDGDADFDTQLWLFDFYGGGYGLGILGNDDVATDPPDPTEHHSAFGNAADDGSNAEVTTPGVYFLAISGYDNDPFSSDGEIFLVALEDRTEVSGPDGPGGGEPITGWGGSETGTYTIALSGAEFVPAGGIPATSEWALIVMAAVVMVAGTIVFGRRRCKTA